MIKSFIPNTLTLANLASGLLAVLAVFSGDIDVAAYLVGASLIFDFLDGFSARLLGVHSELGKQLDSLADLVTFGVVPGFVMYKLIGSAGSSELWAFSALLIPLFSALRLAKFNIDTRQAHYFIGMPTPANAIFVFSLALSLIYFPESFLSEYFYSVVSLVIISILSSLWLIAEIPLLSLKIKDISWKNNKGLWILFVGIVLLLTIFRFQGIVFIIPLYLIISLFYKPGKQKMES